MYISRDCFANLVADFRTTFVQLSLECVRIFMCLELVAKVLNMLKNFMRFCFAKIFQGCRETFVRLSHQDHASFVNLLPRNFGEFTMQNFGDTRTNAARQSGDSLEKTCEHIGTIWRENKTKRHSYERRATHARMSRDCRTNRS